MAKKPVSTSVEEEIHNRLVRVSEIDKRSISQLVQMCVEKWLPELERELAEKMTIARNKKSAPGNHGYSMNSKSGSGK